MNFYLVGKEPGDKKNSSILDLLSKNSCRVEMRQSVDEVINLANLAYGSAVIVVSDDDISSSVIEQFIPKLNDHVFMFYISDKINPSLYKTFSRAGNIEAVDWVSSITEISKFINANTTNKNRELVPNDYLGGQRVISFVGVGGGVGNTTLSIEIGIDLATGSKNRKQGKAAVLDLDPNSSQMCDYLNIDPRLDLSDIAKNPGRLDAYMLDIMSSKHSSGLDIYSSKNPFYDIRYREPSIVYLSLLNCIVDNYATTIIDIPNNCVVDTCEILKNSDLIFCVGIFSVPSAKKIKKKIDELLAADIPKEKVAIIITDTDTNFLGKQSHRFKIDSVFKGLRLMYVRRDRVFALDCADTGQSMLQTDPRRGVSQDIHAITQFVIGDENKIDDR